MADTKRSPVQQDLLAPRYEPPPPARPTPQRRFLSPETEARCRRAAWVYGQRREPPTEDEYKYDEEEP